MKDEHYELMNFLFARAWQQTLAGMQLILPPSKTFFSER
jgi:hypothetical protein